ncbi:MAG: hypothetical protein JZU52_11500, partial [Lamprocystis purpurea]|nr:hypothetical protein [Lamprocystis purpurea]
SDDSSGVFGTAVIRDYAPHVRLIARVNRASNVPRLHQAGADFALAVGQVAGQLLAHHLLGESGLSVEQRLRCMRVRPGTLVGKHPWHAGVRERSGASVVAMERGGEVFVDLPADLRVTPEDALFICGTTEGLSLFQREFRSAPWVVGAGT